MFGNIRWRIAIPYMILILLAMASLVVYLSDLVRDAHLADLQDQLTAEAQLVGDALASLLAQGKPGETFDAQARRYADLLGVRVTIIGADGTVLGESHEDRTKMDNHLYRLEVQQALAEGQGSSIRFSQTVGYEMMYVAVPVMAEGRMLFLCSGNSARSQMAEGLVNHLLGDRWEAYSAGTAPTGHVHPLAIQVMAELGVDISRQHSKSVDEFREAEFDLVIIVCDQAAQNCPLWLGPGQVKHMGFPDPAAAIGSETERLKVFRQVRNGLRQEVLHYLEEEMEDSATKGGFYATATGNL